MIMISGSYMPLLSADALSSRITYSSSTLRTPSVFCSMERALKPYGYPDHIEIYLVKR